MGAATTLAVDAVASEATQALRVAHVPSILLKGRSFADWLYEPGEPRHYRDCDLLVSPDDFKQAGSVLSDLGFRCWAPGLPWIRGPVEVDLHDSLIGIGADEAHALSELRSHSEVAGHAGGVPLNTRTSQVWTIRQGKIRTIDSYTDPREALEAVGLWE